MGGERTGGGEGIVLGEGHLGLEVATIVERVGIQNDQGDRPFEDIVVNELLAGQLVYSLAP